MYNQTLGSMPMCVLRLQSYNIYVSHKAAKWVQENKNRRCLEVGGGVRWKMETELPSHGSHRSCHVDTLTLSRIVI